MNELKIALMSSTQSVQYIWDERPMKKPTITYASYDGEGGGTEEIVSVS